MSTAGPTSFNGSLRREVDSALWPQELTKARSAINVVYQFARMKHCSWCGHENTDEARRCCACGESEFSARSMEPQTPRRSLSVQLVQITAWVVIAIMLLSLTEVFSGRMAQSKDPPPGWDPHDGVVFACFMRTLVGVVVGSVLLWFAALSKGTAQTGGHARSEI